MTDPLTAKEREIVTRAVEDSPAPVALYQQMSDPQLVMLYRAFALDIAAATTEGTARFCQGRMAAIATEMARRGVDVRKVLS